MASVIYEYDYTMINEMVLYMENDEVFYDLVRCIKELYFGDKEIDAANIRIFNTEVIEHAAIYAFDYFVDFWNERESNIFLRAEYSKACKTAIPNLMETC